MPYYDWSDGTTAEPATVLVDGVEAAAGCVRCDTDAGWADLDFSRADVGEGDDPSAVAEVRFDGVPMCRRVRGRVTVIFGAPRRGTFITPIFPRPTAAAIDPSPDPGPRIVPRVPSAEDAAASAASAVRRRKRPR